MLNLKGTQYLIFRLTLPGRIIEDGREKAKFDIDKGRSHGINSMRQIKSLLGCFSCFNWVPEDHLPLCKVPACECLSLCNE